MQNNKPKQSLDQMRKAMIEGVEQYNYWYHNFLDMVEQSCEKTLSSNSPGSHIVDKLSRNAFLDDIKDASFDCKIIRDLVDRDEINGAIHQAILLGQRMQLASFRNREHNAWTGCKVEDGGRKGQAIANLPPAIIQLRNIKILESLDQLSLQKPHLTKAQLDDLVSKQLDNVSSRMVRSTRERNQRNKSDSPS